MESSPQSVMINTARQDFYDWKYGRKQHLQVCSKFNFTGKVRLLSEIFWRFALFTAFILCLCAGNALTVSTAVLLFVLRFAVQLVVVNQNSKHTGGGKFFLSLLFLDYISPFVDLILFSGKKRKY
jgi:hypothetical protein